MRKSLSAAARESVKRSTLAARVTISRTVTTGFIRTRSVDDVPPFQCKNSQLPSSADAPLSKLTKRLGPQQRRRGGVGQEIMHPFDQHHPSSAAQLSKLAKRLGERGSPPQLRRGGCAIKKRCGASLIRADGVVWSGNRTSFDQHHPVRSIKGGCAVFFLMSRPPLLG